MIRDEQRRRGPERRNGPRRRDQRNARLFLVGCVPLRGRASWRSLTSAAEMPTHRAAGPAANVAHSRPEKEMPRRERMRLAVGAAGLVLATSAHAASLPRYDHIVIVVEENKDYEEIISNKDVPFLNRLAKEGASLTQMFAEE